MNNQKTYESLYNFCGMFDQDLKKEYKKLKLKEKNISFPQFCIATYSNILDEIKDLETKN